MGTQTHPHTHMNIPKETILGTPETPEGLAEAEQEEHYHHYLADSPQTIAANPLYVETLHVNSVYGQWLKEKT